MELSSRARTELRALANGRDVSARIATRARIVLWAAEGRMKKDIAMLAGVSRPTVDFWIDRYGFGGVAALHDRPSGAPREQIPPTVRGRILALTRSTPPIELGLSHWSSREMANFLNRTEGIAVSHTYVATVWREAGLKPWQAGTFKLSRDPSSRESRRRRRPVPGSAGWRRRARPGQEDPGPGAGPNPADVTIDFGKTAVPGQVHLPRYLRPLCPGVSPTHLNRGERRRLEAAGDPDDAGSIFAGGEVAGLLGGSWAGPVGAVADEEARVEDLEQEGGQGQVKILRGKSPP